MAAIPVDLSIIVPCFNEIENIPLLQQELLPAVSKLVEEKGYQAEIVFVDDGSSDGTLQALQGAFSIEDEMGVQYQFAGHPQNLGLGAALRTGFSHAGGDIIVTADSDGTYGYDTLPELLSLLSPDTDIVTASPYHPEGKVEGVPFYRLVLSQGSSLLYRLLVDRRIHTYTCLYRAYRAEVVRKVGFQSDGFLAGTELLVNAIYRGYKIREYPAILRKRVYGVSKARILRTIMAHLGFQWKLLKFRFHLTRQTSFSGV